MRGLVGKEVAGSPAHQTERQDGGRGSAGNT